MLAGIEYGTGKSEPFRDRVDHNRIGRTWSGSATLLCNCLVSAPFFVKLYLAVLS